MFLLENVKVQIANIPRVCWVGHILNTLDYYFRIVLYVPKTRVEYCGCTLALPSNFVEDFGDQTTATQNSGG